jgi:hypothetical protein
MLSLQNLRPVLGVHLTTYVMDVGLSSGAKRVKHEADHLLPCICEIVFGGTAPLLPHV